MEKLIMTSLKKPANDENQPDLKVELTDEEAQQLGEVMATGMNPMFIDHGMLIYRDNFFTTKRVGFIYGDVCEENNYDLIKSLLFWNDGSKRPVYLYIDSYGGDASVCTQIIDLIEALQTNGIDVYTVAMGKAMSAGAMILAAGSKGKRYAFPSARIMLHQASGGAVGTIENIDQERAEMEILNARLKSILTKAGLSKDKIEEIMKKDTYLSAKEAKKFSVVDKVQVLKA